MTDELKPCPFCGGEAVNNFDGECYEISCELCFSGTDWFEIEDVAISAWNRRAEPENKPLTWDELKEMEGQPVYIKALEPRYDSKWVVANEGSFCQDEFDGEELETETFEADYENYDECLMGVQWLAYRRKPEEA